VALIAFTVGCALVPAACAPSPAAQSAFDQYVGKTCTGIIPWESGYLAGRKQPVVSKFFRTSDGRPGVSFKLENRNFFDPLVSLKDDGLNFTGQYGTGAWMFTYESRNHLSAHVGITIKSVVWMSEIGELSCS
jgi:hypothetical protein